jgi:hypothetical protein
MGKEELVRRIRERLDKIGTEKDYEILNDIDALLEEASPTPQRKHPCGHPRTDGDDICSGLWCNSHLMFE